MRQRLVYTSRALVLACVALSAIGALQSSAGTRKDAGATTNVDARDVDKPTSKSANRELSIAEAGWQADLTRGVNGPIPLIVVDQFGYPRLAPKFAIVRDPQIGYDSAVQFSPGTTYAVVETSTGRRVKTGSLQIWNNGAIHKASGDRAWWFDFSDVTTPGTYTIVDVDRGVRSASFEIDDGVYRHVLNHAMRMYYYQRAGMTKSEQHAGAGWSDAASHVGPGQDPESRSWIAKAEGSLVRDLRGGWFDAGDYNKYTSWTARSVIVLLRSFEENPISFGDDSDIPESGNGIPDILDEVKWALDWLKRMQNPDGAMLCVQGLEHASPPSAAAGPSYYGPPTTAASLMGAAVFAHASKFFSARPEAHLNSYGDDLLRRANRAWHWAAANPKVLYFNNDNEKQPGSGGLASGQQEMSDAERLFVKFEAAVYLYEMTGEARFKDFAEANYSSIVPNWGPDQWQTERQEALLYYAGLPGGSDEVKSAILKRFVTNVTTSTSQLPMVLAQKDAYRAPIAQFTWGSNQLIAAQGRLYQLLSRHSPGNAFAQIAAAKAAALDYLHYIHGVNPLGMVYLTNMSSAGAELSASTMFHHWFSHGSARWAKVDTDTPGPPPGYLVGGPNPSFAVDSCCSAGFGSSNFLCNWSTKYLRCRADYAPPLAQPAMKSYRDFNVGWPVNSWSVTEPSIGYQAKYVRLLAAYVR